MSIQISKVKKWMIYTSISFCLLIVILFLLIHFKFFTGSFIEDRESGPESITLQPDSLGLISETVRFPARDGLTIESWFLPTSQQAKANIILAHGGGSNRSRMLGRAAFLINSGYNVLAIDLRAHGGSEGNLNSFGMLEALDVLGAVDYLNSTAKKRPIVFMGFSLGSAASINAAAQFPKAAAVIAEGAIITYEDALIRTFNLFKGYPNQPLHEQIIMEIYDWPCIPFLNRLEIWYHTGVYVDPEKTDCIQAIRRMPNVPVLFITGENDKRAPVENVKVLFKASKNPDSEMKIIEGAGHSAFTSETRIEYEIAVLSFLERVLKEKAENNFGAM